MLFRKKQPQQVYELVDQDPESLQGLNHRILDNDEFSIHSDLSTDSIPHEQPRQSIESTTSGLFDEINAYSEHLGQKAHDFNDDAAFFNVWRHYMGQRGFLRRSVSLSATIVVVIWLSGLILYSIQAESPVRLLQTNISKSRWLNGTLNHYSPELANITLTSFLHGEYLPEKESIEWLSPRQYPKSHSTNVKSGYYKQYSNKYPLVVGHVLSKEPKILLDQKRFVYQNNFFDINRIILNPAKPADSLDGNWHIAVTDEVNQWRRLTFALYWLYHPLTGDFFPIQGTTFDLNESLEPHPMPKLSFAEFSPDGEKIVFSLNHDLYMMTVSNQKVERVTSDGSADILNGKADWVYEEEIFYSDRLLWWAPDSSKFVYAKLNETEVPKVELDYYIKDSGEITISSEATYSKKVSDVNQYPISSKIPYPKPGTKNPVVKLYVIDADLLSSDEVIFPKTSYTNNELLYSLQWTSNNTFVFSTSDRTSKLFTKAVYDGQTKLIFTHDYFQDFGGWVEETKPFAIVEDGYVDKVVVSNKTTLGYYKEISASKYEAFLPDGVNEVLSDSPIVYRKGQNSIYFMTTGLTTMDTQLMCYNFVTREVHTVTGNTEGRYEVNFSPDGEYAEVNYHGPQNPWQKLIRMSDFDDYMNENDDATPEEFFMTIEPINAPEKLSKKLALSNVPTRFYKQIEIDSYVLNVIEIVPPNFQPKGKKYPLLVYVYGGPGSQSAEKKAPLGFQDVASAVLDVVILIIDPRGTGPTWKLKSCANMHLGYWGPKDVTTITREYIKANKFINDQRTAIWGWSYGGFLTLKTLETDKGETFKYGVAVAPVTNWMFYDSIYTERYMSLPGGNAEAYEGVGRINDFSAFQKVKRFFVMQGTADDNVHLQNLYWFADNLNFIGVENYDLLYFPDSDHLMSYHRANERVFSRLLHWLGELFSGQFDGVI